MVVFGINQSDWLNQTFLFSLLFSAVLGSSHVRTVRGGCVLTSMAGMPLIISTKSNIANRQTRLYAVFGHALYVCVAIDQSILFADKTLATGTRKLTLFFTAPCLLINFICVFEHVKPKGA